MFFWLFLVFFAHANDRLSIEVLLSEKGTRAPLQNTPVFLLPLKVKAFTNEQGKAVFELDASELNGAEYAQLIVQIAGYKREEKTILIEELKGVKVAQIYVEREERGIYETTIHDRLNKKEFSKKTLKREEFTQMPGSVGDPLRAVQNLPGINRPQQMSSSVVIQGSGPQDTQYLLNEHQVPLVFHFGGLSSILIPEAVDRVDIFSAGYGAQYGFATGGLVGAWTRPVRRDRAHGLAFVDVLNAGVLFETPVGEKSGFMIAARQSYIGEVLKFALKDNSNFDLTVAPRYSDLTLAYETEFSQKDSFRVLGFGSRDELKFLFKEPLKADPVLRGDFESGTSFFRIIPEWKHRHSERTQSEVSLGFGRDWIKFLTSENYFRLQTHQLTARAQVSREWNPQWNSKFGLDHRFTWAHVDVRLPALYRDGGVANPLSAGTIRESHAFSQTSYLGFFFKNEIHPEDARWTFMPDVRVDRFAPTREIFIDPRPGIRFEKNKRQTWRFSMGRYHQPPQPQELNATFGNPNLQAPQAWHWNLGWDQDWKKENSVFGPELSTDFFYKRLTKLVSATGTTENYANSGRGYAVGIQTQLKCQWEPWSFSTIYTLSRSRRELPHRGEFPAQYDQTHLLGLLASVNLGSRWSFGARFRYATGNPYTPIVSSTFDNVHDVYIPERGAFYSQRFPAFHQLDLRLDKKWIFNTWILSAYLDILNATNREHVETWVYSYNYREKQAVKGIPMLPTFGLKAEF